MTRKIHVNEGFFGRDVAEIDDNGRILMPEGIWGHKVVGYLKDDGIYVDSGIMSQKRVIDIASDGNMYLSSDAGVFSYGTWVGRIAPDGKLYDRDRRNYATITGEKSKPAQEPEEPSDSSSGHDGGSSDTGGTGTGQVFLPISSIPIPFLLLVGLFTVAVLWVPLSSLPRLFSSAYIAGSSKVGLTMTLVGMGIATGVVSWKTAKFTDMLCYATMSAWATGTAIFVVYSMLVDSPSGTGSIVFLIVGGAIVCISWALGATVVVGIPIFLVKKLLSR